MRIAACADVHLGNPGRHGGPVVAGINTRGQQVLTVLRRAVQEAAASGAEALVIAGDLMDSSRMRPQWIRAAQEVLGSTGMTVHIISGNHDQESTAEGDNALTPLKALANVQVHEIPTIVYSADHTLVLVPFQPGPASKWFPKALDTLLGGIPARNPRVLAFHLGVKDATTAPWLVDAPDSIDATELHALMVKHSIGFAIAGNWHDGRQWEVQGHTIVQCGALCPTGWNNPGLDGYGGLVLYDTLARQHIIQEIPGPRFLKATTVEEATGLLGDCRRRAGGASLSYLMLEVPPAELTGARAFLAARTTTGEVAAGEVIPDDSGARDAAHLAGRVARSAETLEEAVTGFVGAMALPDGVKREEVLADVRQYMKKG